jgi:hypothetical protein
MVLKTEGVSRRRKSTKRIVEEGRKLRLHRWTHLDIVGLSNVLRSKIKGWLNYYGKFHKSAMKIAGGREADKATKL